MTNVIVAMPLSRILIEDRIQFAQDVFAYPPGEFVHIDARLAKLDPAKLRTLPSSLRQTAIELSGISWEILDQSPLLVFQSTLPSTFPGNSAHAGDLLLLERFAAEGERYLDRLRFEKCDFDFPDTLPGRVGTWDGSEGFSGALAYDVEGDHGYLLGGKHLTYRICIGIGLDPYPCRTFEEIPKGEVGTIVSYALRLYTNTLEAFDWTTKYVNCVRLFEYLADPFQTDRANNWDVVKQRICLHVAKDKGDYIRLTERFRLFGNIGSEGVRGYREQILHHGRQLEAIVESKAEMRKIFRELQSYATKVMKDMIAKSEMAWAEFEIVRKEQKTRLGIS
jgi:hypothetical protein